MKIQKKLLYGLVVVGAICLIYYYGNKVKPTGSFGDGGSMGGNGSSGVSGGNQPPVPTPIIPPAASVPPVVQPVTGV